jgi:hypothetical protein
MSALRSSTSYSKAAAQKSARAGAFVLSMTNFQPSGTRPVSRESNDPSNRRKLTVRKHRPATGSGHLGGSPYRHPVPLPGGQRSPVESASRRSSGPQALLRT